jgi:beta-mannosidase
VDLSGTWRAQVADEDLRRAFPGVELDDSPWPELDVPGHWRSAPAFAGHDGPMLYRRRFDFPPPEPGRRIWLTLEGLFYLGDVWLDGAYVGDTEGYFFPHTFDVTEAMRERREHLLAVEVTCTPPTDRTAKRNITGVFEHWDCLDPDWNPGGIWRPVRVDGTGPVRITRLRTLCREATDVRAVVGFTAELDAADATTVTLRTTIGGTDHQVEQPLATGANKVEWTVTVERPALWWPHALGAQPLCDAAVEVLTQPSDHGEPSERSERSERSQQSQLSDRRAFRTGLRQVQMKRWVLSVNGERLFVKGSNQGPTRMALAEATPAELASDVRLAKEAGLDLLRVHSHVTRAELYDAADQAGLLLWQDMPLQWGYARGIRKQAARQAREAVDLLGHHPSVAIWCGHNEPLTLDPEQGVRLGRLVASMELPTWNKTVLDHSVTRALETADPTRPVIAHSGVWPSLGSGGTDAHLYFGWYHGHERDLPRFLAAWPRFARFVSEFGAQAVPMSDEFMEPDRWPDLDWDRLRHTHALQKPIFDRFVPPADFATLDAWRQATQQYQATVIKHHVETLRRLKYRPAGGFCHFCFADGHPAVTWSVLDHQRAPKAGHLALQEACAPVIVVAERPAATYAPGDPVTLDVHVVSDLRTTLDGVRVQARLRWPGGDHAWAWEGPVAADSCVLVGTVQAVVPAEEGALVLDLELEHENVKTSNRYESLIVEDPLRG